MYKIAKIKSSFFASQKIKSGFSEDKKEQRF
jgi:hypothetical protein